MKAALQSAGKTFEIKTYPGVSTIGRVGRARKFSISETFSATMRSPDLLRHVEAGAARSALPSANRMGSAACVRYLDRRL